jgi:signal transduction histidine kinase
VTVGQRLFLAVVPAILGVFAVAGLAYWGQYDRQAPHVLVAVGVVASVASLFMVWMNTRYVARRIQRLAGAEPGERAVHGLGLRRLADAVTGRAIATDTQDELDRIELTVDRLTKELEQAKADGSARAEAAERRAGEYAVLLSDATSEAMKQLDEARLPLYILLDNHFGDLNENQEEMLGAAQAAVQTADQRLRRLREIADVDRGAIALRHDAVLAGDLIASLLPNLNSVGQEGGVEVKADIAPALPRVSGDRSRLQQACSLLLTERLKAMPPGASVQITAVPEAHAVRIDVTHADSPAGRTPPAASGADAALARRLIAAIGGTVEDDKNGNTVITLPTSSASGTGASPGPTPAADH